MYVDKRRVSNDTDRRMAHIILVNANPGHGFSTSMSASRQVGLGPTRRTDNDTVQ
jgi:hypothetical protein